MVHTPLPTPTRPYLPHYELTVVLGAGDSRHLLDMLCCWTVCMCASRDLVIDSSNNWWLICVLWKLKFLINTVCLLHLKAGYAVKDPLLIYGSLCVYCTCTSNKSYAQPQDTPSAMELPIQVLPDRCCMASWLQLDIWSDQYRYLGMVPWCSLLLLQ